MEVRRVQDPRAFASETRTLLLADEARHNLILGITTTLMDQPEVYREFHLWVAERNGEVEGCAVMTPPFNLVVSRPRHEDVLSALAHTLYRDRLKVPGVTGAIPEVEQFASAWRQVAGVGTAVEMRQRIYELRSVRTVPEPSGGMRDATASDRSLLLDWILSFARDAHLREGGHPDQVERIADARLSNPKDGYVLWEDGEPVSLVGYGGSTPSGIRIGPVYTPTVHRGRGYATALTARISSRLLDSGRQFCFLYTDVENPTSNRIYERIGYAPVCDSLVIRFT